MRHFNELANPTLVLRVRVRMQQADRNRIHVLINELLEGRERSLVVERFQD